MDKFWIVTLFQLQPAPELRERLEQEAVETHEALGIEEFSLDEAQVDELLGERSYSGGDLPDSVIDEVENIIMGRPATIRFFFSTQENGEGFLAFAREYALCESQLEEHPVADWNAEWKKHYAPILINEKLAIVPAWEDKKETVTEKRLLINPGMGFGTGSHETTFLCLRLFTEKVLGTQVSTTLDFGSGSGILGLAALLFYPGAKVDFYDIDPEANKNCYHNAEINSLEGRSFRLLLPEVREKLLPQYDVVFANILENILLAERDELVRLCAPGGWLILSGLLNPQATGIIKTYARDLHLVAHETKGHWSALLFRKAK